MQKSRRKVKIEAEKNEEEEINVKFVCIWSAKMGERKKKRWQRTALNAWKVLRHFCKDATSSSLHKMKKFQVHSIIWMAHRKKVT